MNKRNSDNNPEKRMLNLKEAAIYIGMGERFTRQYMDEIGATRKFGTRVAFDKRTIDAVLDTMQGEGYNISVARSAH